MGKPKIKEMDELLQSHSGQLAEKASQLHFLKTQDKITDFNLNQLICKNASSPLSIPTYVPDDDMVVHPSVLFFPERWNGYSYWMAFTPYTNTDSQYENPSIVVSNDGITWTVPIGLTNPMASKPADGYNADTHIFMDKDGATMHLIYRERSPRGNIIKLMSTINGINWSVPTDILQVVGKDNASPCVIYDNNEYKLFSVNLDQGSATTAIQMYTAKNIGDTWIQQTDIQIPNIVANKQLWHFEIRKYGGVYVMLYTIATYGNYGGDGLLYMATSTDLVNWNTTKYPILNAGTWDAVFYKSSFLMANENGTNCFYLWYGTVGTSNTWLVGFTKIYIDENNYLISKLTSAQQKNINNSKIGTLTSYDFDKFIAVDDYNRADNTSSLGIAPTGQTWVNLTGALGISSNSVYNSNGNNAISTLNAGANNFEASVELAVAQGNMWIAFRATDYLNYLRVGVNGANISLQKVVAGVVTNLLSIPKIAVNNDVLKIKCIDANILVFLNDIFIGSASDTFNQYELNVGVQTNSTIGRFKNFVIKGKSILGDEKNLAIEKNENKVLKAINKFFGYLIGDNFGRVNSATTLGTAPTGQNWTNDTGVIGILNSLAYCPNAVNSRAFINAVTSDLEASVQFQTIATNSWLIARYSDASNYIRIGSSGNSVTLQKIIAGVATTIKTSPKTINNGDVLMVVCIGSVINVFLNDIQLISVNDTFNQTATYVGLQSNSTEVRFSNFVVKNI